METTAYSSKTTTPYRRLNDLAGRQLWLANVLKLAAGAKEMRRTLDAIDHRSSMLPDEYDKLMEGVENANSWRLMKDDVAGDVLLGVANELEHLAQFIECA